MTATVLAAVILLPSAWAQDYAVIVHPSNSATLKAKTVSKIFLAKTKKFPGGGQAVPIMQKSSSAISKKFIADVLKKRASQYKSYWSKMVFTGKGNPPKEVDDDAKAKALVTKNPSIIAIVAASAVDDTVKVALKF